MTGRPITFLIIFLIQGFHSEATPQKREKKGGGAVRERFGLQADGFIPLFDDPVGDDDRPLLIQCKTSGAISQFEKELVKSAAEKYGCLPVLASKTEDKKIKFEVLK